MCCTGLVGYLAGVLLFVAQWSLAADYISHQQQGNVLAVTTTDGLVKVTPVSEDAIEVHYLYGGNPEITSFSLDGTKVMIQARLSETEQSLTYATKALTATIDKAPFRIRFSYHGKPLVDEEVGFYRYPGLQGFRFSLDEQEKLLGGGQRVLGMNRRGHRLPLYNRAHYGYGTQSNQMYYGLPAVLSSKKYALIFDNSAKATLDIGKSDNNILQFEGETGRMAYVVVAGRDYTDLVSNLTEVTGRQPLPPRWALGNFASRFGYKTEQQTRDVVARYAELDFPLDAVVLDLYWFGKDIKGHMGNLDWDRDAFPTPVEMIRDFSKQGVNTIVITEPFVLTTSKRWQEAVENDALARDLSGAPKRFDFYFGNTGLIDVFHPPAQTWFAGIYKDLYEQGIGGWWGDLGEPEVHPADTLHQYNGQVYPADTMHNAYGHQWAKLVYETQKSVAPDSRPMVMMRAGFMGSQRYGLIPWTGDVSRSWDGLKPQVELSLQMGMLGLAYTHSDLGGFAGGETFDREMYIRWLQYGVFQPVYRPHAQDAIAPEPVFHDSVTQSVVRDFIKLRYRMLPYNYTLVMENALSGMPLMRPMMMEAQGDGWFDVATQYMWGDALLVRPITEPGSSKTDVILPEGIWFNFWTDKAYRGSQTVSIDTPLEQIPVMVKAGAFLPMSKDLQTTRDYSGQALSIHYYADTSVTDATYTMLEDDGLSAGSIENKAYRSLVMTAQHSERALRIDVTETGDYEGAPGERHLNVVVHNATTPERVTVNGKDVSQRSNTVSEGWFINEQGQVSVPVTLAEKSTIRIELHN